MAFFRLVGGPRSAHKFIERALKFEEKAAIFGISQSFCYIDKKEGKVQ